MAWNMRSRTVTRSRIRRKLLICDLAFNLKERSRMTHQNG